MIKKEKYWKKNQQVKTWICVGGTILGLGIPYIVETPYSWIVIFIGFVCLFCAGIVEKEEIRMLKRL